jgi:hypothetical protein
MAPAVWFVLNLNKGKYSYLEVSGAGLTLTDTSTITVTDTMNGLSWDVSKKWVYQGKLRLRLGGKWDPTTSAGVVPPDPTQATPKTAPTTGTVTVTVDNPAAGTINTQVGYVTDDQT